MDKIEDKLDKTMFFKAVTTLMIIVIALMGVIYDKTQDNEAELKIYKDTVFETMVDIKVAVGRTEVGVEALAEDVKSLKEDFKRLEKD